MPGTVEFWEYLSPMLVTVTGSPGLCIITIHSVTGRLDFDNAPLCGRCPCSGIGGGTTTGKRRLRSPKLALNMA